MDEPDCGRGWLRPGIRCRNGDTSAVVRTLRLWDEIRRLTGQRVGAFHPCQPRLPQTNVVVADASCPVITISGFPDKLVMTSDLCVRCRHGLTLRVARGGGPLRGDSVERCHRRRCDNGAPRTRGAHAAMPGLLAANLRLPPPQRLRYTRRAGPHPIVFSASPRKRNACGASRARRGASAVSFSAR